jgi:hypothetical protein
LLPFPPWPALLFYGLSSLLKPTAALW